MAAQIIADVTAIKLVTLMGIVLPGGTLVYALTFTLTDFIQRKMGKRLADQLVVIAAVINIGMALYFQFIVGAAYPTFWPAESQLAFASTIGIVWTIVGPSILAELVAGLLDNLLYHVVRGKPALGMLLSNAISVPVDSLIFAGLAFGVLPALMGGHALGMASIWQLVKGQVLFKWIVGAVIMPVMFFIRKQDD
jgi:uncharacterized integral membrane protein (TIGR00697 family)